VAERPPYPDIPTAVTRRESDLLVELTAGKRVLEIGSYLGYSTVWMALNGAIVTAVDPHDWMDSWLSYRDNVRRYGVTQITDIRTRSQDAVGMLPQGAFEAAFIDGDHAYEQAKFDLTLARQVVRRGGWIIAHDYTFPGYNGGGYPEVIRAVDEVLGDLPQVRRVGVIYAARLTPPVPADAA
jgi:predicted O-methyltransferase YrrM